MRQLSAAGAVSAIGHARYVLTQTGRGLLDELPLAMRTMKDVLEPESPGVDTAHEADVETLVSELESASRDSSNPERFEKACAIAFQALGVEATHLGGPGRTDVLVTIESNLEVLSRAIIDAKSSAGQLTETSIKFDALKEHAQKHRATSMAVVAPGFDGAGRLVTWAEANGVVLLTAAELGTLLRAHERSPFSAVDIAELLTVGGRERVEERHTDSLNQFQLVTQVLRELSTEATQASPEPIGARDIGRVLRRSGDPVSDEQVAAILAFLSRDEVRAVQEAKDGTFTLPSSLSVAARRLRALARAIEAAAP